MIFRSIFQPKIFTRLLFARFSNKQSIEQQAYFEHRKQTMPNFSYQPYSPTISIKSFKQRYSTVENLKEVPVVEKLSGRITAIRVHGKTTFVDIREQHQKVQLVIRFQTQEKIKRGDIIGAQGQVFYTKKGELSLLIQKMQILSPCLWMLPEYQSLKDHEVRYRQRHLDLITNSAPFEKLKTRAKIMSFLRRYLENKQFLEVETPTLSSSAGGAIAKPFKTYHNDFKTDIFMRIAPELYLKKLLIGGFQKVYEIGKNFRNEGVDQTHNPEFTSCQLYQAYSDYEKMQRFTEDLICSLVKQIRGSHTIVTPNGKEIDLTPPWPEVNFIETLEKQLKTQFPTEFQSEESYKFINQLCIRHQIDCDQPRTVSRLIDKLGQRFVESINHPGPLFVKNHPKVLSPLAKPIPQQPHLTQRFELFINGWELVNSYTQLNDPEIQRQNTPSEEEYIEALEYGLMPCAGWGMGIDRLVMLLTQSQRIQEVIAYPLLRKKDS